MLKKCHFKVILLSYDNLKIEYNIHAPVLLDVLNLLPKSYKMLSNPHILSLFTNLLNKFNNTCTLM